MTTFLGTWEKPGEKAVKTAWQSHQAGRNLRSALEDGLAACELDPTFLAIGLGSLPNSDGELELDAAMMDGADLEVGAVCAVRGIVPVISVARRVMEDTRHNMLAGDQARRFAIEKGFRPQNLVTAEVARQYDLWRAGQTSDREYTHTSDDHGDTVTMLGLQDGHLVAGRLQDETARHQGASAAMGQNVDHRQHEAGGLARPGLGDADDVLHHQYRWYSLRLNRGRRIIASLRYGLEQFVGKAEIGKSHSNVRDRRSSALRERRERKSRAACENIDLLSRNSRKLGA